MGQFRIRLCQLQREGLEIGLFFCQVIDVDSDRIIYNVDIVFVRKEAGGPRPTAAGGGSTIFGLFFTLYSSIWG
eukprot:COSAG01_NODE_496_length_16290_cov_48.639244_3_plen_74_part_00